MNGARFPATAICNSEEAELSSGPLSLQAAVAAAATGGAAGRKGRDDSHCCSRRWLSSGVRLLAV